MLLPQGCFAVLLWLRSKSYSPYVWRVHPHSVLTVAYKQSVNLRGSGSASRYYPTTGDMEVPVREGREPSPTPQLPFLLMFPSGPEYRQWHWQLSGWRAV